jgi:hypothetical protein
MKTENTYHIDVTEEENLMFQDLLSKQIPTPSPGVVPNSFKKTLFIVLGFHVIGLAAVFGLPQTTDVKAIIRDLLPKETAVASPSPTPAPELPATEPAANISPTAPPLKIQPSPSNVAKAAPTPVKEYVVKKGDNFNKIVKKYKLNSQTLIKLNNIKNTNSLKIGQKLKFM